MDRVQRIIDGRIRNVNNWIEISEDNLKSVSGRMEKSELPILNIARLRAAVNEIFNPLEDDLNINSTPLSSDYYWNTPDSFLFNVEDDVGALDIGSLVDDLSFATSIVENKGRAASNVTWVFDSLSRVQSTTGAVH